MGIPEHIIEEIKSRWREVLPTDGSGKGVVCPLCGNGSGSDGDGLRETPTPNVLKCFKCDFAGDVIKAVQEANHYNFYEAVKYCADQIGIRYDDKEGDSYKNKPAPKPATPPPTPVRKRVKETDYIKSGFFREAEKHLEETDYWQRRGLSLETAKHFKLGFDKSWINPVGGYSKPSPRLIIPTSRFSYLARDTREIVPDLEKRYTKLKVSSVRMFNTDAALEQEITFVVEGEIDAMSIYEVGYNALALGSTSNKEMLINRLKNPEMECNTKIFVLVLDNDEAGQKTSKWLEKELAAINFPYIVSNITGDYKDVNDYLVANREKFAEAVKTVIAHATKTLKKGIEKDAGSCYNNNDNKINNSNTDGGVSSCTSIPNNSVGVKNGVDNTMSEKLLTSKEAANLLGIPHRTFKLYVQQGKIKPTLVAGGRNLFRLDCLLSSEIVQAATKPCTPEELIGQGGINIKNLRNMSLEERANKLEEIAGLLSSKNKKEATQIALNYDNLRLADSVANTEYHYVFADFRNRVKDLKIIGMQEFDRQINIAAGRNKKLDNGAVGEGRSTRQIFPDCPINLTIPHNFVFENGGIFNHKLEVASYTPIVVTRIFKNLDENNLQKYEIQYKDTASGKWHSLTTEKSCLADAKKIVGLSDTGLDVNSYSAKVLIPFISELVAKNPDIPVINSYSRPGWKGEGFKKFICAPAGDGYVLDSKSTNFKRIFTIKGDRDKWLDLHRRAIKYKYYYLTSGLFLLTPVIPILNIRNSMAHLYGRSGGGKTAALKLAVSTFADPKYYIKSFNATQNYIIEAAIELTNHAFCLNELQTVNNKKGMEAIDRLPYLIENGDNRKRLNKNASIKDSSDKIFSTIAITTGENPFTTMSSEMGKKVRVLEFGGNEILPQDLAQEIHVALEEGCHGHFYRPWIDYISNPNGRSELKDCYQELLKREEVKKAFKEKNITHRNFIVGSSACVELFGTITYNAPLESVIDNAVKHILMFAEEMPDENEITDVQRAINTIQSVISERQKHFLVDSMQPDDVKVTPIYGIIDTDPNDGFVGFYPDQLRIILEERGFNPEKIIKEFLEIGAIKKRDKEHNLHYIQGSKPLTRYYKIPFGKLNQDNVK